VSILRILRPRRSWLTIAAVALACGLAAPQLWAWAHLRLAQAAVAASDTNAAQVSVAVCLGVWPDRVDVHLIASRAARQAGEFEQADRELRTCQKLNGGSSDEIAFEWALLQAAAGNVREVEDFLQAKVERDPRLGPIVWESLVEGYLRVFRTIDAMATVDHWLGQDPENLRALELRGMTFVIGKGVKRGSDDLRRVVERDPNRLTARAQLVRCLLDLGGYKEATTHLEWLARDRPDDPEVLARLARCRIMLDSREEARQALDAALAVDPDHGLALRTYGQLALLESQPAEAERWLRRAVASFPNDYQTQFMLVRALIQQGKQSEAVAQLRITEEVKDRAERVGELQSRKLGEQPLDPALHVEMALILFRTGQPAEAERWLFSALSLDPDFAPAHAALADHYERTGDKARAAEHRRRVADVAIQNRPQIQNGPQRTQTSTQMKSR
jgi:protein O-GlcNAc transferase